MDDTSSKSITSIGGGGDGDGGGGDGGNPNPPPPTKQNSQKKMNESSTSSIGSAAHRGSAKPSVVLNTVDKVTNFFSSAEKQESNKLFSELDSDGSRTASQEEIGKFVHANDELWSTLSEKLKQPPEVASQIATRVAMELATGLQGKEALEAHLTKDQFHQFRQNYILSPEGSQEFFYRAVFANFDMDGNAVLDETELGDFLDTIYESGLVFHGGLKLPPRDAVKQVILEKYDVNNDRRFSYNRVRGVMSGEDAAELAKAVEEFEEKARKEKEVLQKKAEAERLLWEAKKAEQDFLDAEKRRLEEAKRKAAAQQKDDKEEWDFCDWLDRKISPNSYKDGAKPPPRQNFCRRNNCCIQ